MHDSTPVTPTVEPSSTSEAPVQAQGEGRRTQLKIVREHLESLSGDVDSFKRSHEASSKALEAKIASLRKDVASLARSKDLEKHVKSHDANSKKLQQQVASLRAEVAALKAHVSKEVEKSRAKEEATLSKILAKVSKKPAAAKPPAKK